MFSLWWLVSMILISGSIALAVGIVYSAEINVQEKEAKILYDKIYDCITENGRISDDFLENSFDVFSKCNLNEKVFSGDIFSFRIRLFDEEKNLVREEIQKGFPDIAQKCVGVGSSKVNPKCFKKESLEFYLKGGEVKNSYLEVFTASNNRN